MIEAKICGLCRPGDGALAAAAGARYAGVVLVPGRSRCQSLPAAGAILDAAAGLLRVGVFADATPAEMLSVAERLRLDVVQLHGREPPELLEALRRAGLDGAGAPRLWKAIAADSAAAVQAGFTRYAALADAILLDGGAGGAGQSFDWSAVAAVRAQLPAACRLVVAGGLHAGNVGAAVQALRPDVVDVSSGVEAAPGCKSETAVRAFLAAVAALS